MTGNTLCVLSSANTKLESMYFISFYFVFNDTATTKIYTDLHTLSLRDALPICQAQQLRAPMPPMPLRWQLPMRIWLEMFRANGDLSDPPLWHPQLRHGQEGAQLAGRAGNHLHVPRLQEGRRRSGAVGAVGRRLGMGGADRKRVGWGKRVSVRVDPGRGSIIKKKKNKKKDS